MPGCRTFMTWLTETSSKGGWLVYRSPEQMLPSRKACLDPTGNIACLEVTRA